MVEVWMWEKYPSGGSFTLVNRFKTKEEADRYIDFNRNGRNVVFVNDDDERDYVWRLIGAKCLMSLESTES